MNMIEAFVFGFTMAAEVAAALVGAALFVAAAFILGMFWLDLYGWVRSIFRRDKETP